MTAQSCSAGARRLLLLNGLTLLLLLAFFTDPSFAQELPKLPVIEAEEEAGVESETDETAARAEQERLEKRLAEVENELQSLPAEETALTPADGPSEKTLLDRLSGILAERLAFRRQQLETEDAAAPAEDPTEFTREFVSHGPPFSLGEYDSLLDRLASAISARELLEDEISLERQTLESESRERDERQQRQRELEARLDRSPENAFDLGEELRRTRLSAEIASERVALQEDRLEATEAELERAKAIEDLVQQAADLMRPKVEIGDQDRARLQQIEEAMERLRGEAQEARTELQNAEDLARQARAELDRSQEPAPVAMAQFEARQEQAKNALQRVALTDDALERLQAERESLTLRLALWSDELEREELLRAPETVERFKTNLERQRQRRSGEIEQARVSLQAVEAELEVLDSTPARRWLEEKEQIFEERIERLQGNLKDLDTTLLLVDRTLDEVDLQAKQQTFGERLGSFLNRVDRVWSYELTDIQGSPITVGNLTAALMLLIIGYGVARRLSSVLAERIFKRMRLDHSVIATLQTLSFYALLIAVFLIALWLVNIPLTVFTFLGGALAIGVGFGSQNIVNNFISGLILMVERPVKVGDLIEVNEITGVVQRIGARSTQILSGNNTHLIVPNSSFLESNVLNWTHSDYLVRTQVDVGVAYGSPTERVAEILLQVASEDSKIEETPAPEVLFLDFGDNALLFRLLFWTRLERPTDLLRRQSALRFRIDALCREAEIVIAYPQRDLHLDTLKPLQIEMIRGAESS